MGSARRDGLMPNLALRARFAYGPDGARYRRIDDGSQAGGTTTTTIIGVVERVQKPSGAIQWRRLIGGVAIVSYSADQVIGGITQAAGAGTVRHQFTDRLGSVQVIGSISGAGLTVHAWLRPQQFMQFCEENAASLIRLRVVFRLEIGGRHD